MKQIFVQKHIGYQRPCAKHGSRNITRQCEQVKEGKISTGKPDDFIGNIDAQKNNHIDENNSHQSAARAGKNIFYVLKKRH